MAAGLLGLGWPDWACLGLQKKWTKIGPRLGYNLGLGLEPNNDKKPKIKKNKNKIQPIAMIKYGI